MFFKVLVNDIIWAFNFNELIMGQIKKMKNSGDSNELLMGIIDGESNQEDEFMFNNE